MQQAPYNNHADLSAFESDPFECYLICVVLVYTQHTNQPSFRGLFHEF